MLMRGGCVKEARDGLRHLLLDAQHRLRWLLAGPSLLTGVLDNCQLCWGTALSLILDVARQPKSYNIHLTLKHIRIYLKGRCQKNIFIWDFVPNIRPHPPTAHVWDSTKWKIKVKFILRFRLFRAFNFFWKNEKFFGQNSKIPKSLGP